MMHLPSSWRWLLSLLFLAFVVGSGCASTEGVANDSERPWNTPQSWESGMGGMFNQYR